MNRPPVPGEKRHAKRDFMAWFVCRLKVCITQVTCAANGRMEKVWRRERRERKTKIHSRLTKPATEKAFSTHLVSFRRLSSPPNKKIVKIRRGQSQGNPDYKCGSHLSFLSLSVGDVKIEPAFRFIHNTLLTSFTLYVRLQKKFTAF